MLLTVIEGTAEIPELLYPIANVKLGYYWDLFKIIAEPIHHMMACFVSVGRLCRNCILVHLPYGERMVRGMEKSHMWLCAFVNFHLGSFKLMRVLLLKVKFSVSLFKFKVQLVWVFPAAEQQQFSREHLQDLIRLLQQKNKGRLARRSAV